jgi:glycerol-3-phosphate dehydrogenase
MKTKLVAVAFLSLALALPLLGKTYKSSYPVPCSEVWSAVKDTLGNSENYNVVESNDSEMTASYQVKHSVHVNITGAILQRTNHVTLVSNGPACEMRVVSNFSGWEHNDRDDFKKRVDESLVKLKAETPSQPAKPEAPGK